jgi:hypothetical protein
MSIQLSQLLHLSHALSCGRKRQAEWEAATERNCRSRCVLPAEPIDEKCSLEPASMRADDVAEMRLLRNTLASQDTFPRAADTENTFLRLWCAANKSSPTASTSIEGSDFQWMVCIDSEQAGTLPAAVRAHDEIHLEVLCPPKSDDGVKLAQDSSDDTFARLLDISGEEEAVAPSLCAPPSEGLNAAHNARNRHDNAVIEEPMTYDEHAAIVGERRLPEALERLSAILNMCATSKDCEDEFEDDEDAEEMHLIREMSREAMLEAEREELKALLVDTALDVAVSAHCTVE